MERHVNGSKHKKTILSAEMSTSQGINSYVAVGKEMENAIKVEMMFANWIDKQKLAV
jgi:hypothetical protein